MSGKSLMTPSLDYSKVDHGIRGNINNAQISPVSMPPEPLICPSDHSHLQDVHFLTRFPWGRSTPGAQQTVLNLNEIPQWGPSRGMQYQLLHVEGIKTETITDLVICIQIRQPLQVNNAILLVPVKKQWKWR